MTGIKVAVALTLGLLLTGLAELLDLWLEDRVLWAVVTFLIVVDTITGMFASARRGENWTSKAFAPCLLKVFGYLGAIMVLGLIAISFEGRGGGTYEAASGLRNWAAFAVMFRELWSILENTSSSFRKLLLFAVKKAASGMEEVIDG